MNDLDGLCEAMGMAIRNLVSGDSISEEYDIETGKPFEMKASRNGNMVQINIKINNQDKQIICPECHSRRLIKFGIKLVKRQKAQQYQCKDCGRITVKPAIEANMSVTQ